MPTTAWSGVGTSTGTRTYPDISRREGVTVTSIECDNSYRYAHKKLQARNIEVEPVGTRATRQVHWPNATSIAPVEGAAL